MGGFQGAGTGKNKKKLYKIPPACQQFGMKGSKSKNLKNHIFSQKWPILIMIFVFSGLNIK